MQSSSGDVVVDLNNEGTSVLGVPLTINAGLRTSVTSSPAPTIIAPILADDVELTLDIDSAGTGAAGLKVWLLGSATDTVFRAFINGASVLGEITQSATGALGNKIAQTLFEITQEAVSLAPGKITQSLFEITQDAAGTQSPLRHGVIVQTLGEITQLAGGQRIVTDTGYIVSRLFEITQLVLGQAPKAHTGTIGQTLGFITQTGAMVTTKIKGNITSVLAGITQSAEGEVARLFSGPIAQSLFEIRQFAQGTSHDPRTGTIGQLLGEITQHAVGEARRLEKTGVIVQVLGEITQAGVLKLPKTGVIVQTLGEITQHGVVRVGNYIEQTLGEITQQAISGYRGSIVQALGEITQEAAGTETPAVTGHRYWRLDITATGLAGVIAMGEIELMEGRYEPNLAGQATITLTTDDGSGSSPVTDGFSGYSGSGTWDGNNHNWGLTGTGTVDFDFGSGNEKAITTVQMTAGGDASYCVGAFKIQYSDDGSTWTDATTSLSGGFSQPWETRTYNIAGYVLPTYSGQAWGSHSYYRLQMLSQVSSFFVYAISEFQMRTTPSGADVAAGSTTTVSSTFSGQPASNMYDGNDTTYWASTGVQIGTWIKCAFGSPTVVTEIMITARHDAATGEKQAPGAWVMQFSDDDTNWTTMWSNQDTTGYGFGETRVYTDPSYI